MKKDSELINEYIKNNDSKAFEEIILRHQQMVYNSCLKVLRNPTDANDAVQATFLTLIKKAKSLKHKKSLPALLHKIGICISKNIIRKNIRQKAREERYVMKNKRNITVISNRREAQEINILYENSAIIEEAIASLPERYSLPIIARYYEEKTEKEIGEDLGASRNTIATRLRRGLEKLHKKLTKKGVLGISTIVLIKYLGISSAEAVPAGLTASLYTLAATGTASVVITTAVTSAITAIKIAQIKIITGTTLAILIISAVGYSIFEKFQNPEQVKHVKGTKTIENSRRPAANLSNQISNSRHIENKNNPTKKLQLTITTPRQGDIINILPNDTTTEFILELKNIAQKEISYYISGITFNFFKKEDTDKIKPINIKKNIYNNKYRILKSEGIKIYKTDIDISKFAPGEYEVKAEYKGKKLDINKKGKNILNLSKSINITILKKDKKEDKKEVKRVGKLKKALKDNNAKVQKKAEGIKKLINRLFKR
jgi:RNA polymerase sigma factor (sigma-70 family)